MSLIFGAAAFGWIGVAVGVAGLILLFLGEVYREAARLSGEREGLKEKLTAAQASARSARDLESKNADLERTVDDLRRQTRQPILGPGQLLLGIKTYLDQIKIVRKHRTLQGQVKDALVTQLEMTQGKATVSAVCPEGAEHLDKQAVAFVHLQSDEPFGNGLVVNAGSQDVRAIFELSELPTDLVTDLSSNGSFSPQGYVLRLLGLSLEAYQRVEDSTLKEADEVLSKSREVMMATLLPQASHNPDDLLRELEAAVHLDEPGLVIGSSEETATLDENQGGGS
jgi:hypothetical protein